VILMIGDGMGRGPLEAAAYYRNGAPLTLAVHRLPHRGELTTVGLDGTTDSAAAATAMASGVFTHNGAVGLDRLGRKRATLIDLAHTRGMSAGIVTTSSVTHATPAAFTAHAYSREQQIEIAARQVSDSPPEVLLGGGSTYFRPAGSSSRRDDGGLIQPLIESGYSVIYDGTRLGQLAGGGTSRLIGLFAPEHMPYALSRAGSRFPSLETMAMAAIEILDRDPEGFFLMIEGARIDMAGHSNNLPRMIGETLAFDDAVDAVARWAARRDDVMLIVTADHDTGAIRILDRRVPGKYPLVRWRTQDHTDQPVDVFAMGPGTEVFNDTVRDHRWVHAVAGARIGAHGIQPPPPVGEDRGILARLGLDE
jgi:alkaline phosphatase